jgi:RNA polymerase sigma-70 factor (ECF subfamily)
MRIEGPHEERFTVWLAEYRGILLKVARAYAREPADQSDLLQEMALQLWRSLPAFREHAAPSTWIYRVCLNTAMTWRRGVARRQDVFRSEVEIGEVRAAVESPAESAGQRELVEKLYRAIQTLPDFDRALVLLALDGLAYREIAEVTGLTENHVGVALLRARKRLAEQMKGAIEELE